MTIFIWITNWVLHRLWATRKYNIRIQTSISWYFHFLDLWHHFLLIRLCGEWVFAPQVGDLSPAAHVFLIESWPGSRADDDFREQPANVVCESLRAHHICAPCRRRCPSLQGRAQLSLAADAINCLWLSFCERLINERPSETPLRADNVKANPRAHSLCGAHAELLLPPPPSRPDR